MKLIKLSLALILCASFSNSFAQKTVKAEIKYRGGEVLNIDIYPPVTAIEGLKCRKSTDKKNRIISCVDLEYLKTERCEYNYVSDSKDEYLARLILDGKLKLYVAELGEIKSITNPEVKYSTNNSKLFSFVYFIKKGGKTQRISKLNFKKAIQKYIADDKKLMARISSKELTFKDIKKIVELYNN